VIAGRIKVEEYRARNVCALVLTRCVPSVAWKIPRRIDYPDARCIEMRLEPFGGD
jgi:hypothetical protein